MAAEIHYLASNRKPPQKGTYLIVAGPSASRRSYYRITVSFALPSTRGSITPHRLIESPEAAIALATEVAAERKINAIYVEHTVMPKGPTGQKPPESKKLPRNLPEDPVSRAVSIMRTATKQADVGDTADKITRAPKKKR